MNKVGDCLNKAGKFLVVGTITALLLSSCGGGGGSGQQPATAIVISGTVATGLPLADEPVAILDVNGVSAPTATTTLDGTYSTDVSNLTAPFLIQVRNPAGGFLYSVATAGGTANVHPFTDMIVRNWFLVQGSDVDTVFSAGGAMPTPPTANDIAAIETVLRQILSIFMTGANVNPATFNLITTSFDANQTGFDLVLENLTVTQPETPGTGNPVTIGLAGGGATAAILTVADTTNLATIPVSALPPVPMSDTVAPTAPGAITTPTRTSTTQVVLSWGAASDTQLAGYKIYRSGTQIGITDQPFYIDDAAPETSACYKVSAYDAAGNSSEQNTEVCASDSNGTADTTAPTAPDSLTAVASSSSQIDLAWLASTDDVALAGYRVMVSGAAIATLPDTATTYSHIGLTENTLYSYTVVAIDMSGNATSSAEASDTTFGKIDTTAPTQPTGLTATAVSASRIDLAWAASEDDIAVAGYKVYLSGALIGTSATAAFSAINLAASTQYCYTVKAYDAEENISDVSTQACTTTP